MQVWADFHRGVGWVAWSHKFTGVELLHQNVLNKFKLAEWLDTFCYVPSSQSSEAKYGFVEPQAMYCKGHSLTGACVTLAKKS